MDNGTGTFDSGEDPSVLVQCPLDTGDPSSLPAGTVFPYAPLAHSALFLTRDPAGDVRVSVIRAR